jgi:subtilisin family serine protease
MFQAVLEQRRRDGTPQIANNSYGFVGIPPRDSFPTHEIHDLNHPLHRKVREVITSGCTTFFAAGNCGSECPSGACHPSGIGAGRSIHGSNALKEVITIAAVNSRHDRIGYSSQGPGMFERQKPDLACYSHFFGNFGPGRPAGGDLNSFDNGTSAATPVAAGVAALLLSAFPGMTPVRMRQALLAGAIDIGRPGWDAETGFGVINAGASYQFLRTR